MRRPIIALIMLAASAPALATDWRLVVTDEERSVATFVDLDSIRSAEEMIRTVSTYNVNVETDRDGIAAETVDLRIDCADRRLSIYRMTFHDEEDRPIGTRDMSRPWVGPFEEDSQGRSIVDFVCSDGATDPLSESWGAERPFREARQRMRELAQPK